MVDQRRFTSTHSLDKGFRRQHMLSFRDPIAAQACRDARRRLACDEGPALLQDIEAWRGDASPASRMRAGAAYCVLAEADRDDGRLVEATHQMHFAGHVFRSVGMEAKAALAYEVSYRLGIDAVTSLMKEDSQAAALKLQDFNERSIGRAVACFRSAGQPHSALRAQIALHDAQTTTLRLRGKAIRTLLMRAWGLATVYSLSWSRSFAVTGVAWALATLLHGSWPSVPLFGLGLLVASAVMVRRWAPA